MNVFQLLSAHTMRICWSKIQYNSVIAKTIFKFTNLSHTNFFSDWFSKWTAIVCTLSTCLLHLNQCTYEVGVFTHLNDFTLLFTFRLFNSKWVINLTQIEISSTICLWSIFCYCKCLFWREFNIRNQRMQTVCEFISKCWFLNSKKITWSKRLENGINIKTIVSSTRVR